MFSGPSMGGWACDRSGARTPEDLDAVAGGERHDGALGVLALAHPGAPAALALALAVDRVDAQDLHVEDLLDSDLDLCLVRLGQDDERVLVLVQEPVALLGDDRGEQDVPVGADGPACSPLVSVVVPVASSPLASTIEGTSSSTSVVARSGKSRALPLAGPATNSARAVSGKTTSSAWRTS